MEYYRAAKAAGREILPCFDATEHSGVTVIIRPNSPTGDFMPLNELETILKNSKYGLVVIDESFMPFQGPNWRKESALQLIDSYPGRLIVIHSWTKFWSCPGIRLGSVAASSDWIKEAKRLQIPWSCNTVAQAFLVAACSDEEYMRQTWSTLPEWRKEQETIVEELGWKYNKNSPLWVPWVFVDCGDASVAEQAAAVALSVGCPVRHCASFGCPQYIRLGVRDPKYQQILYKAWKNHFDSQRNNP
jgi:histidinol-phosphate/aromatic aminotransferase/cobyric acid decarboxylase-like protein